MTTTTPATGSRPLPQPPRPRPTPQVVAQLRLAAQLREVTDALPTRRSSQALDTALLEVKDAALAKRALCPVGECVQPSREETARAQAVQLRLDSAIIRAAAAGASTHQIEDATNGAVR